MYVPSLIAEAMNNIRLSVVEIVLLDVVFGEATLSVVFQFIQNYMWPGLITSSQLSVSSLGSNHSGTQE